MSRFLMIVGLVLLMSVACSAQGDTSESFVEAQLQGVGTPGGQITQSKQVGAPVGAMTQARDSDVSVELTKVVEALAAKVATLEARLDAFRWTEDDAIEVVKRSLNEKVKDCGEQHTHSLESSILGTGRAESCIDLANLRADPILSAIKVNVPGLFISSFIRRIQDDLEWTATYEAFAHRWRVWGDGESTLLRFLVSERTGLVEADTRTAEQLLDDILKETEANR